METRPTIPQGATFYLHPFYPEATLIIGERETRVRTINGSRVEKTERVATFPNTATGFRMAAEWSYRENMKNAEIAGRVCE